MSILRRATLGSLGLVAALSACGGGGGGGGGGSGGSTPPAAGGGPQPEGPLGSGFGGKLSIVDPLTKLPTVGSWKPITKTGAPKPCLSGGSASFWTGSKLLVFGTLDGAISEGQCLGKGFVYDPAGDTWKPMADDPKTKTSIAAALFVSRPSFYYNGKMYLVSEIKDPTESRMYDVAADAWSDAPTWPRDLTYEDVVTSSTSTPDGTLETTVDHFVPFELHGNTLIASRSTGVVATDLTTMKGVTLATTGMLGATDPTLGKIVSKGYSATDSQVIAYGTYDQGATFATHGEDAAAAPGPWKGIPMPTPTVSGAAACPSAEAGFTLGLSSTFVAAQRDRLVKIDKDASGFVTRYFCASAIDPASGAIGKAAQVGLGRDQFRTDAYEYVDYDASAALAVVDRAIYQLRRIAGLSPHPDDASKKIELDGTDRRFLVFDAAAGTFAVTPAAPGDERDHALMTATANGFIVWGGEVPTASGSAHPWTFYSDGGIFTFP